MGVDRLNTLLGTVLTPSEIRDVYSLVRFGGEGYFTEYYLKLRGIHPPLVTQLPDSAKGADEDFFIVSGDWYIKDAAGNPAVRPPPNRYSIASEFPTCSAFCPSLSACSFLFFSFFSCTFCLYLAVEKRNKGFWKAPIESHPRYQDFKKIWNFGSTHYRCAAHKLLRYIPSYTGKIHPASLLPDPDFPELNPPDLDLPEQEPVPEQYEADPTDQYHAEFEQADLDQRQADLEAIEEQQLAQGIAQSLREAFPHQSGRAPGSLIISETSTSQPASQHPGPRPHREPIFGVRTDAEIAADLAASELWIRTHSPGEMPPKKKSAFGSMVMDFAKGKSTAPPSQPITTRPEVGQPQLVIQAPSASDIPPIGPMGDPPLSSEDRPLQVKRRRLTKGPASKKVDAKGDDECLEVNPDWAPNLKFPDGRPIKYNDAAAQPDTAVLLIKSTILPRDKRRLQDLSNRELSASAISHAIQVSLFPYELFYPHVAYYACVATFSYTLCTAAQLSHQTVTLVQRLKAAEDEAEHHLADKKIADEEIAKLEKELEENKGWLVGRNKEIKKLREDNEALRNAKAAAEVALDIAKADQEKEIEGRDAEIRRKEEEIKKLQDQLASAVEQSKEVGRQEAQAEIMKAVPGVCQKVWAGGHRAALIAAQVPEDSPLYLQNQLDKGVLATLFEEEDEEEEEGEGEKEGEEGEKGGEEEEGRDEAPPAGAEVAAQAKEVQVTEDSSVPSSPQAEHDNATERHGEDSPIGAVDLTEDLVENLAEGEENV